MRTSTTGKARIYANERTRQDGSKYIEYSTTVGSKKQDGTWENAYPKVNFAKCQAPQVAPGSHVDIEIDNGFFSFEGNYTPKLNNQPIMRSNGKPMEVPVYKVVVMGYHLAEANQNQSNQSQNNQSTELPDSFAVVDEDEPW